MSLNITPIETFETNATGNDLSDWTYNTGLPDAAPINADPDVKHYGFWAMEFQNDGSSGSNVASIEKDVTCYAGNITFWLYFASFNGGDIFNCYLDGTNVLSITPLTFPGLTRWQQYSVAVATSGTHHFKLESIQDGGFHSIDLDDIYFPDIDPTLTPDMSFSVQPAFVSNGSGSVTVSYATANTGSRAYMLEYQSYDGSWQTAVASEGTGSHTITLSGYNVSPVCLYELRLRATPLSGNATPITSNRLVFRTAGPWPTAVVSPAPASGQTFPLTISFNLQNCGNDAAVVFYTLDGSTPTLDSPWIYGTVNSPPTLVLSSPAPVTFFVKDQYSHMGDMQVGNYTSVSGSMLASVTGAYGYSLGSIVLAGKQVGNIIDSTSAYVYASGSISLTGMQLGSIIACTSAYAYTTGSTGLSGNDDGFVADASVSYSYSSGTMGLAGNQVGYIGAVPASYAYQSTAAGIEGYVVGLFQAVACTYQYEIGTLSIVIGGGGIRSPGGEMLTLISLATMEPAELIQLT